MSDETRKLEEIGKSVYESIEQMVLQLNCDYERLGELSDLRDDWDESEEGHDWVSGSDDAEELAELQSEAGDCEDSDEARQLIEEDPLSILVRSSWHYVCDENPVNVEFQILLSTGGPASRIIGELNSYNEPSNMRLEVQDWGTPWTEYRDTDYGILVDYCECFYFGE